MGKRLWKKEWKRICEIRLAKESRVFKTNVFGSWFEGY